MTGRSEGRISQLVADGTLKPGGTAGEWLKAMIDRLSSGAAGRGSDGPLDLVQERAALARAQREGVEIKNATLRGQYADVAMLAEVLGTASQAVAERFEHLPGWVRKACPDLPPEAIDAVMKIIATARNEWVAATAELVAAAVETTDDDE